MKFNSKFKLAGLACLALALTFSAMYFTNQNKPRHDRFRREIPFGKDASVGYTNNSLPKFTFNDIFGSKFSYKSITPRWISGNQYIYSDSEHNVYIRNAETKQNEELLMSGDVYVDNSAASYQVSSTQEYILLLTNYKKGWRHSYNGTYLVFNVSSQELLPNETLPEDVQYISWSPVGNALVYVKGFDIYYRKSPRENDTRVTNDGRSNYIYNGIPDWVYEEEMISSNNVLYFSPDGSKLAFAKFNDTDCKHLGFIRFDNQHYPHLVDVSYPKAGETQPSSQVFICDVSNPDDMNCKEILPQQTLIDNGDYLFNRVVWANATRAAVLWCNRAQTWSVMSFCDFDDSNRDWKCFEHPNFEHRVANGWLYQRRPYWIPVFGRMADEYFSVLPSGGYQRLARVDQNDIKYKSWDAFTVTSESAAYPSVYFYHEESDYVYFLGAHQADIGGRQIYRVRGNDNAAVPHESQQCVTCSFRNQYADRCQFMTGSFSTDGSYLVVRCRGGGAPLYAQFYVNHTEADFNNILIDMHLLEENQELVNAIETTQMSYSFRYFFPSDTGYIFNYELWLPPNFDAEKKYPLLIDVYAGPGYQNVQKVWTRSWAPRYVPVALDVIVLRVDGRGSNFNGDAFMYEVYRSLGQKEIADQIEGARYFGAESFIDESRIAIWGWSYGGFATSHAIALNTGVIKCGFAVAPVTDWRFYDTIYTERYMGMPTEEDNLEGYNAGNVMNKAENFANSNFYLIHGMADDNVHFQNAARLEKALVDKDVSFKNFFYADQDHSINVGNARKHVYRVLTKQLCECFDIPLPDDVWS